MWETVQNVRKTTEEGLCTSCGVCAAICPVSCIRYKRQNETYLPVINSENCIQCGKCLKVCPGYSYTYHNIQKKEPMCFSVQAKNKRILRNATSGGLVTAMVYKLLQDEQYQTAFLVTDYDYENQIGTTLFHKGDNLQRTQQSRYLPISQEKAIKFIIENPHEKVIFVGTGCAVHGLCNALRESGRSRKNILVFGLFCDQTMTYSIYEYMKKLKTWNSPVKAFHFRDKRAGGWPGNLRIEFQNGTYVHLPSKERMLVKDFCRQKRCLYCMDKLNAEADLSMGDNYTKKNDSKEGVSSLIVRTELGQQVWEYCRKEFWVLHSDYEDIRKSQHLDKKLKNQWVNNMIFAERHQGRKVECGVPYDLTSFEPIEQKVTPKDRKQLTKQLAELELGEQQAYSVIRRKRFIKLGKMYFGGLPVKLHLHGKL